MNAAGRLEAVLQLYDVGLLCKCSKIEEEEIEDPVHGLVYKKIIKHELDCMAKEKAREIMNFPDNKDPRK